MLHTLICTCMRRSTCKCIRDTIKTHPYSDTRLVLFKHVRCYAHLFRMKLKDLHVHGLLHIYPFMQVCACTRKRVQMHICTGSAAINQNVLACCYIYIYTYTKAFAHLNLYRHRFAYLHAYTFIYVQNCICTQVSAHKCTCWHAQQHKHIHIHNQIVHLFVNQWMQICVQVYLYVQSKYMSP